MRIIARNTLAEFWISHPEAEVSLKRWYSLTKSAGWTSANEILRTFPKAVVLNAERVRFEIAGGNYRLIASFDFGRQLVFVKFLGTHAEYDRIDALTVSKF